MRQGRVEIMENKQAKTTAYLKEKKVETLFPFFH
jgi:hypothetical protein